MQVSDYRRIQMKLGIQRFSWKIISGWSSMEDYLKTNVSMSHDGHVF